MHQDMFRDIIFYVSNLNDRPTFEMISEMFLRDCFMGYFAISH